MKTRFVLFSAALAFSCTSLNNDKFERESIGLNTLGFHLTKSNSNQSLISEISNPDSLIKIGDSLKAQMKDKIESHKNYYANSPFHLSGDLIFNLPDSSNSVEIEILSSDMKSVSGYYLANNLQKGEYWLSLVKIMPKTSSKGNYILAQKINSELSLIKLRFVK